MAGISAVPLAGSFEAFFRDQFNRLVAIAYGLTGRRMLAEELAQEAMLVVHRRWGSFESQGAAAAFARRVVANQAMSAFRRLLAEGRALNRVRAHREQAVEPAREPDESLWRAVRALPPRQAQAVTLRYVAELDTREIAAVLDCSEGNVRVILHRARQSLALVLGRQPEEEA